MTGQLSRQTTCYDELAQPHHQQQGGAGDEVEQSSRNWVPIDRSLTAVERLLGGAEDSAGEGQQHQQQPGQAAAGAGQLRRDRPQHCEHCQYRADDSHRGEPFPAGRPQTDAVPDQSPDGLSGDHCHGEDGHPDHPDAQGLSQHEEPPEAAGQQVPGFHLTALKCRPDPRHGSPAEGHGERDHSDQHKSHGEADQCSQVGISGLGGELCVDPALTGNRHPGGQQQHQQPGPDHRRARRLPCGVI